MIVDRYILLLSKISPATYDWNPKNYMDSRIKEGVIQLSKIVKTESGPFTRIIALVTYAGVPAIFKMHKAHRFTSYLVQVSNELNILHILYKNSPPKSHVRFPKIFRTHAESNEVYGIREYLKGTQLSAHPSRMIEAYDACLSAFTSISSRLSKRDRMLLPKRSPLSMLLTFPVVAVLALIKNRPFKRDIWFMIKQYIRRISVRDILRPVFDIAHRDLSPENILIMKNAFGVIDAEVAALCEKGTDLSLFPRFYYRFIPKEQLVSFLRSHLLTSRERAAFVRLTTYYTLHYLAVCAPDDTYYEEARGYTHFFTTTIYPSLKASGGSAYEKILKFLLALPLKIGFQITSFAPTKDFILCYHSISDDANRYTTTPGQFQQQVLYLRSHTSIVSLSTMLTGYPKSRKTRVSITFDDGYKDTYTTAFPYLSATKMTGAVFVIGDTMKNGKGGGMYLDKQTMTIDELKTLYRSGWEIGFHTQSHTDLRTCTTEQIHREMTGSKKHIEKYTGASLRYIAYPFGGYTKEVRAILSLSGFEAGFTTDSGTILHSDISMVPRVDVEGALTHTEFRMLCSGYGLWISALLMKVLTGKISLGRYFSRTGGKLS